jgi:hypothetical protein
LTTPKANPRQRDEVRCAAALTTLVVLVSALDTELAGFQHFHNWDFNQIGQVCFSWDDQKPAVFPLAIALDVCATDSNCKRVLGGGDAWSNLNYTETWDVYLAYDTTVAPVQFAMSTQAVRTSPHRNTCNANRILGMGSVLIHLTTMPPPPMSSIPNAQRGKSALDCEF